MNSTQILYDKARHKDQTINYLHAKYHLTRNLEISNEKNLDFYTSVITSKSITAKKRNPRVG